MSGRKLIALDMDGTLLSTKKTILPETVEDMEAVLREKRTFPKMNIYFRAPEDRDKGYARLKALPLEFAYAETTSLEMTPKNVSKGSGLKLLAEHLGIDMGDVIAVGDADYEAPVLKLKNYSMDDLFRKNLLLLVPYFPFLLEGRMEEMNAVGYDFKDVQATLDDINCRLDELIAVGAIDETKKQHMLDWLQRVFDKLAAKYDNTRKGVDRIMKGYMLHTRTDDILDQGRRMGKYEERQKTALRMSDDGLSIEKIAQYVGESVETVRERLAVR